MSEKIKCNKCGVELVENCEYLQLWNKNSKVVFFCKACYEKDKVELWKTYGDIFWLKIKSKCGAGSQGTTIKSCGHTGDRCYYCGSCKKVVGSKIIPAETATEIRERERERERAKPNHQSKPSHKWNVANVITKKTEPKQMAYL